MMFDIEISDEIKYVTQCIAVVAKTIKTLYPIIKAEAFRMYHILTLLYCMSPRTFLKPNENMLS